jgi:hypothetical protein
MDMNDVSSYLIPRVLCCAPNAQINTNGFMTNPFGQLTKKIAHDLKQFNQKMELQSLRLEFYFAYDF